jgi:hypothetical protein
VGLISAFVNADFISHASPVNDPWSRAPYLLCSAPIPCEEPEHNKHKLIKDLAMIYFCFLRIVVIHKNCWLVTQHIPMEPKLGLGLIVSGPLLFMLQFLAIHSNEN